MQEIVCRKLISWQPLFDGEITEHCVINQTCVVTQHKCEED